MKMTVFLFTIIGGINFTQNPDEARLGKFINKVETLFSRLNHDNSFWTIPNNDTGYYKSNMPVKSPFFVDHETKLHYSPPSGIVYDPNLQIKLDVREGVVIDEKSNKKYNFKDLLKRKNQ